MDATRIDRKCHYELIKHRTFFACQAKKEENLRRIMAGDEKWIYYNNHKRKKSRTDPDQPSTSTPKRNIHGQKILLCIWWEQHGVLYYELLKPNETVTTEVYKR